MSFSKGLDCANAGEAYYKNAFNKKAKSSATENLLKLVALPDSWPCAAHLIKEKLIQRF
jgi:hypothetical protein